MEVILREHVPNLGRVGEIVKVKDGYARNYLIPQGLAYVATAGNKRRIESEAKHHAIRLAEQKADARSFQAALRALAPRHVLTTHPLLAQHVSALWREKPMLLARAPRSLARAVADLRAGGVREFLFVVPGGAPLLGWIDGLDCRLAKRQRGPHLHYFDLDIQRCGFGAR